MPTRRRPVATGWLAATVTMPLLLSMLPLLLSLLLPLLLLLLLLSKGKKLESGSHSERSGSGPTVPLLCCCRPSRAALGRLPCCFLRAAK